MDTLHAEAVPYNPGSPSTIYFQDGCQSTHLQGGRVYDAIGNQKPPDILKLWNSGQAVPFDLQQALVTENMRRKIEKEMAEKYAKMEAEAQFNLDRVNREIQEIQDREAQKLRRPLEEFNTLPSGLGPVGPQPHILPEMQELDFLNSLVPITPEVVPNHLGLSIVKNIASKIRESEINAPGYYPGQK